MTLRDSVVPTCLCPCCGYLLDRAMAAIRSMDRRRINDRSVPN